MSHVAAQPGCTRSSRITLLCCLRLGWIGFRLSWARDLPGSPCNCSVVERWPRIRAPVLATTDRRKNSAQRTGKDSTFLRRGALPASTLSSVVYIDPRAFGRWPNTTPFPNCRRGHDGCPFFYCARYSALARLVAEFQGTTAGLITGSLTPILACRACV